MRAMRLDKCCGHFGGCLLENCIFYISSMYEVFTQGWVIFRTGTRPAGVLAMSCAPKGGNEI